MEIWRYEIKPMDLDERSELSISMPRHAQLLHVETKDGQPSLWALVDPKAEKAS